MKTFSCVVIGAALVAILLSLLAAGATDAGFLLQACTVEEDGSGTHLTIQAAVNDNSCDPINVGVGTFIETVTISRSVTVQGASQSLTIVDANASGSVFSVQMGSVVTLTGMTIQNGAAFSGGGIRNSGMLHLTNSSIISNSVSWSGAGINNNGVLEVIDSIIRGNVATDWAGGGIFTNGGDTLTVTHTLIENNSASWGGGIGNDSSHNVHIFQSTIRNNYSGGIVNSYGGIMYVSQTTISGNLGGGIGNVSNADIMTVTHSTLSGNSTDSNGGGIYSGDTLFMTDSTLYGNSALGDGGGIYEDGGSVKLANTIIAGSLSGGDCFINNGSITSQGYNLDSDGSCNLTATGDKPNMDPLLGPLQDNGGPNWTMALLEGSPALDAGSCPGITADQRGFPRPVDIPYFVNAADGCDMGAYEVQELPFIFMPAVFRE